MRLFPRWPVVVLALVATAAVAGTIKTWAYGDTLTSADLNANFQHIHNLMVGGHGARLVNADVSSSAAIAHSKLATPGVFPKHVGWHALGVSICSTNDCTDTNYVSNGAGGALVANYSSTAGYYKFTWTVARTDASYGIQVTPMYAGANTNCYVFGVLAASFTFKCYTGTSPVATNIDGFAVTVYDDSN